MHIKPPRQRLIERYPNKYTLAFDVTQWNYGENPGGDPNMLCDTLATPYTFSFVGFLLWQHGVPLDKLAVNKNLPGVRIRDHLYPTRFLRRFPPELSWFKKLVVVDDLFDEIKGAMRVDQTPDLGVGSKELPIHQILERINDVAWALTPKGNSEKLNTSWRAFWLREVTRVGSEGVTVQFHEPRGGAS
jgi:hypothetical protein